MDQAFFASLLGLFFSLSKQGGVWYEITSMVKNTSQETNADLFRCGKNFWYSLP